MATDASILRQVDQIKAAAVLGVAVGDLVYDRLSKPTDTSNASAATIKQPASDPLAATLATKKPEARTFVTSPYFVQQKEISFDTTSSFSKELVSAYPPDKLKALARAVNVKNIMTDAELSAAIAKAQAGFKVDLGKGFAADFRTDFDKSMSEISAAWKEAAAGFNDATAGLRQAAADAQSKFNEVSAGVSAAFTEVSSEVSSAFQRVYSEFPELTSATGKIINASSGMRFGQYNDIVRNGNGLCPDLRLDNLFNWGLGQNLFATLLQLIMDNDLGDLFSKLFSCKKYFEGPYQSRLQSQIFSNIPGMARRGNTGMVRTSLSRYNTFEFPNKQNISRMLTRNASGTPKSKRDLDYIFTYTRTSVADVFTTKNTSRRTAWDNSMISKTNPYLSTAYVGTEVASMGYNMPFS